MLPRTKKIWRKGLSAGPGTKFRFEVHMDLQPAGSSRQEYFEMTLLDEITRGDKKGLRVAWRWLGLPGILQRAERIQEFIDDGNGRTKYICWETFYGLAAPITRMVLGKQLETAFSAWGRGLKKESEKRAGACDDH